MTSQYNFVKNYTYYYIYVKNRMNVSERTLASKLGINRYCIQQLKKDIKKRYLEKKDERELEERKFKLMRSSDKYYFKDEKEIEHSFMNWVSGISYKELSESEKAIYDGL